MLSYKHTLLVISFSVMVLLLGCKNPKETSEPETTNAEENADNSTAPDLPSTEEKHPEEEEITDIPDTSWTVFSANTVDNAAAYGLGKGGGIGAGGFGAGGFGSATHELNENEFSSFQPNQFNNVLNSPFSTFGADVDTASYSILRHHVQRLNTVPANQLLRTEEMLNYFKYDYPTPNEGEPFSVTTELVKTPWNENTQLLLIGIQTPKLKEIPPSNIVYLVDISGSMSTDDKLPLLKSSIIESLDSFTPNDKISIVTYADGEDLLLSGASPISERKKIETAVAALHAGGSTNGERGLELAYEQAAKHFIPGGNNRIIMGTDGDLNVGISSANELKAYVENKRNQGIFLSIMGFGWGNFKDNRMEALADNGNGNYHYIDSIEEAKRVLVEDRDSTLFTVAKDVKFQVDFNPSRVKGYRLIGYETRKLNTEDFKDDKKDGGEIGANQQMTALYEIVPAGSSIEVAKTDSKYQKKEIIPSDDLATLAIRYKKPDGDVSAEIKNTISSNIQQNMSENIQFAAAVAEIGMLLNNSEFKGTSSYENAIKLLEPLKSIQSDPYRAEFFQMVKQMLSLPETADSYIQPGYNYPPRNSKIKMKVPEVTGMLDKRIIQKVVRQHTGELRACYEKELGKNKGLSGQITASWIITAQGSVSKTKIKESTMKNKDVEKCIVNAIGYWRFPMPKGGGEVLVEFPFEFSP